MRDGVVVGRGFLDLVQVGPVDHRHDRHAQVDTQRVAVDHAEERHHRQHETA